MKFFNLITLASLVSAFPQFRRQETVVGTIKSAVDTLADTTLTTLTIIENAAATLANTTRGTDATSEAQIAIQAGLEEISDALTTATTKIARVTTGAVGNVGGQVSRLSPRQVVQLTAALRRTIGTLDDTLDTVSGLLKDLTPEVQATIEAELNALRRSVNPLLRPLLLFTAAVRNAVPRLGGGVILGLDSAFTNLIQLQRELVSDIGVPRMGGI
ncbi:hypothetical protein SNK03_007902 [Fusarium graminearum]|uniref:Chromosome 4, complete genome n=2 Tax=Gibberella zeae TaxID=5518 RepID=I1RRB1_GIBZE|nr:hypothetical protein FGSG_06629 [Fusarium graminearum PH-1]EYB28103.1 hypothetical protein FG05_06629 [Fusarium graminearum]ESU12743.1 hypothetical protein FGSG_06629 [Fusarium graminearum PH-1]KAI6767020.1 hypothetical protein HG531_011380 [Fusarium graminearum]PCD19912.1 hypothetical protein FGRA07_05661 [Fusarium graminearum]CAF3469683.1 unnamed protein product [Fusarium graminearum]|eukprot:XP_011326250.1 hypothetical protein FGSG_06629 [Fusarium graminearum PH-1]